jgi:radical SAM superfamily enzyme YgiQ (UPF0313 family)
MRILFIVPLATTLIDPFAYPPLGPLMAAATARAKGHEVDLCFAHYDPEAGTCKYGTSRNLDDYRSLVNLRGYDAIGLNIFAEATFDAAHCVLENIPNTLWIIAGGAFVTSAGQESLDAGVDIGIIDECEDSFGDLVNVLKDFPRKKTQDGSLERLNLNHKLDKIPGLVYNLRGLATWTSYRANPEPLDMMPFPAWDILDPELVAQKTHIHLQPDKISTTIFATRGCPFNCTFCNREVGGRKFRSHSPDYIIRHLNFLRNHYGVNHVRFPDDLFTTNKKWVLEISGRLQEEGFTWACLSRTDTLDDEMAESMVAGGCQGLFFGIESGSAKMLKLMNKKTSPETNGRAIERCRRFGLASSAYFIFGFPGEDGETIRETVEWLDQYRPDRAHYSTFLPIHGTAPFREPEEFGIKLRPGYRNWVYYDDMEFPVEYLPPNPSNAEMTFFRQQLHGAFDRMGYLSFAERKSVSEDLPALST